MKDKIFNRANVEKIMGNFLDEVGIEVKSPSEKSRYPDWKEVLQLRDKYVEQILSLTPQYADKPSKEHIDIVVEELKAFLRNERFETASSKMFHVMFDEFATNLLSKLIMPDSKDKVIAEGKPCEHENVICEGIYVKGACDKCNTKKGR